MFFVPSGAAFRSQELRCTKSRSDAIALAVKVEIDAQEVAENVVDIRLATDEEKTIFMNVSSHFEILMPEGDF